MNPLAGELNEIIEKGNPGFLRSLAAFGREIFFPKGILTQSAEAKEKAHRFNATIGTARHKGAAMHLRSIMDLIPGLTPDEALNYAPSFGLPELRKAWAEEMVRKNPRLNGKTMSLPVVTAGLTHGLSVTADLFIEPGDEIIIPDKLWGNYRLVFSLRKNAALKTFPLYNETGGFNLDGFARTLEANKGSGRVVVLLNFPNNPTGYTPSADEMDRIGEILEEHAVGGTRVVVICDDAYFGLFYDAGACTESVFTRCADRHENLIGIKLDGATKEDYAWGFRVGFITISTRVPGIDPGSFYTAVEKKLGGTVRSNISNAPAPSQRIVLKALGDPRYADEKQAKGAVLKARALKVKQVLEDPKFGEYFAPYPFNSGYFMCVRLRDGLDAETFRTRLLDEEGIGVISIGSSDIRIAFSSVEEDEIEELFEAMYRCAAALGG